MNNSFLAVKDVLTESVLPEDSQNYLRARQEKLSIILEALRELSNNVAWGSLQKEVFAGLTDRLTADLLRESRKHPVDSLKISRIAGQLDTAEQYDLKRLQKQFSDELTEIKKQLHGST